MWFDALVGNVDRSWRNPNMLLWHRELHLIDHGAALTFHHSWAAGRPEQVSRFAMAPYAVADHALVECRPDVAAADEEARGVDWESLVVSAVAAVPGDWLDPGFGDRSEVRAAYQEFLLARLAARATWVPALVEAVAQGAARDERGRRVSARASAGPPEWIPELRIGREATS